jgi:hypothetical protein
MLQFKHDGDSGAGAAMDASGSGQVGNLLNMNTLNALASGFLSNALQFDGVNDVLAVDTSPLINDQITQRPISLWFRADGPSLSANQTLCEEGKRRVMRNGKSGKEESCEGLS